MATILYPTRGGKESHSNQDFAINLAKEQDADLLFLYVSGISFITRAGPPIIVDIEKEMDEVGDFLLSMAQERAEKAGARANVAIRHGNFSDVLKEIIVEKEVNTVILGSSPKEDTSTVSFEHLQELSKGMSKELDVEFILVRDGEVVFQTGA